MLDPLTGRSGEFLAKARAVGPHDPARNRPLMWGFLAIAGALAFVAALIITGTQSQRPATSVTVPKPVDQQPSVVTTVAKPANFDAAPKVLETKSPSHPNEVDFSFRLKEPAKHQAIQLQAGNSQIFYVYGVGIIKDTRDSLSERSNPIPINHAIAGEAATLGTEVRDGKLWLTGYQQGSSRLIVLDDSGHELYDGVVYVY